MRVKSTVRSTKVSPSQERQHELALEDAGGVPTAAPRVAHREPFTSSNETQDRQAADRSHEPPQMSDQPSALGPHLTAAELRSQESLLTKPCRELMSENPVCCLLSDTIDLAARLMVTEDIGALPVVMDLQNVKLIGIVTDRDLAVKAVAEGCDPKATTVEEVMTYEPVTCRAEDRVQHLVELMAEHQVRRVPVVDQDGRLVGVIAQADIATRLREPHITARVVEEVSKSTLRSDRLSDPQ